MPVTVKMGICDTTEESLICFRCFEKIMHGERHHYWGIKVDKEFVQCSFHRAPTKLLVGLTVLYAFGYKDTWGVSLKGETRLVRVNRVNLRDKVLNPATPSFLTLEQIFELYENPSEELVTKLIDENMHVNKGMEKKAEEELRVKTVEAGDDGIRRGARVLSLDRHCAECGVSEAEMVAKNPKYTLCRGVCVVCYRRIYRKSSNKPRENSNPI